MALRVLSLTNTIPARRTDGLRAYTIAIEGDLPDGRQPRIVLQQTGTTWWVTDEGSTLRGMPPLSPGVLRVLGASLGVTTEGSIHRETTGTGWHRDAAILLRACETLWVMTWACRPMDEEAAP